ncbi:hypothetical protein ABZV31_21220 [Streptomyces sp. NPDC005202]|uniref:hypothetical protein n=1 Tax=Streptomyces sp. NPDC005202 TaxID=3157021 RepID=UPI0033A5E5B5
MGDPGLPAGCDVADGGPRGADVAVAFFRERKTLDAEAPALVAGLADAAMLWIAWPRKAVGHVSDITENALRDVFLPLGVVDVKVAALDEDWSGLKFVRAGTAGKTGSKTVQRGRKVMRRQDNQRM